eukprot:TRINITY_DN5094_c0_g1_i3.p1 TRINITY_DN5094_c0_g1~~TRINITY_DN5094_c0_g1_i3.p1  ORF type:complete len:648 (+),score=98.07 TRINITY_DN5094_c0_g1_i3:41-1984(+)
MECRKLYQILGLEKSATGEEVKKSSDKLRASLVANEDVYRLPFVQEAKGVLGDSALRNGYQASGSGFILADERLADQDDGWLQELTASKADDAAPPQQPSNEPNKKGLLLGAMGWLGYGKQANSESGLTNLKESIQEVISKIGKQFEIADQEGSLSDEAIAATNTLLKELVSYSSKDTAVAASVIEELGVALHIAKLINNPADNIEMKVWSSAVLVLLSMQDARVLPTATEDSPGVAELYCQYLELNIAYFRNLALSSEKIDPNEVEYHRSIYANIFLVLASASSLDLVCSSLVNCDGVNLICCYFFQSIPMLSLSQMTNIVTCIKNCLVRCPDAKKQFLPHTDCTLSLISAASAKQSAVPVAVLLSECLTLAYADVPFVVTDPFVKLFSHCCNGGLNALAVNLHKVLLAAVSILDESSGVAFKDSLKAKKGWEPLLGSCLRLVVSGSSIAELEAPRKAPISVSESALTKFAELNLLSGAEQIGRKSVAMFLLEDGASECTLQLLFTILKSDSCTSATLSPLSQAILDKLTPMLTHPSVFKLALEMVHAVVNKSLSLQVSLASHIVHLMKSYDKDDDILCISTSCLLSLAQKLSSSDKLGSESQKTLIISFCCRLSQTQPGIHFPIHSLTSSNLTFHLAVSRNRFLS